MITECQNVARVLLTLAFIFTLSSRVLAQTQAPVDDGDISSLPPPVEENQGDSCARWNIYWNSKDNLFQAFALADGEWLDGYAYGRAQSTGQFARYIAGGEMSDLSLDVSQYCSANPNSTTRHAADTIIDVAYGAGAGPTSETATSPLPLPTALPLPQADCDIDANDGGVSALPVMQLGQLIDQLLPEQGFETVDWSYLSDQKHLLSRGENLNVTEGGEVCRQALARVSVGKTQSKFLLQHWTELPWSVSVESNKSKAPHPDYIEITTGGENSTTRCFGDNFHGCSFDIKEVLESAPFKATLFAALLRWAAQPKSSRFLLLADLPNFSCITRAMEAGAPVTGST